MKVCPNCHQIDRPIENAEEKLKMGMALETGKDIYYAVLDGRFKSIDLCNWCYSVMRAYRYSLPKSERIAREVNPPSKQEAIVKEKSFTRLVLNHMWWTAKRLVIMAFIAWWFLMMFKLNIIIIRWGLNNL